MVVSDVNGQHANVTSSMKVHIQNCVWLVITSVSKP